MRALLKILVLIILTAAAAGFFLRDEKALAERIVVWAESSVRHVENLMAEKDSDTEEVFDNRDTGYDFQQPDWSDYRTDDSYSDGNVASVTSGYTLSSEPRALDNNVNAEREDTFKGTALSGTVPEHVDWVKKVTQRDSPHSWQLLMLYDDLPDYMEAATVDGMTMSSHKPMESFEFLEGNTATEILGSMGTNVHETAHGYFGDNIYLYAREHHLAMDWDNVNGYLYLSPSESFFISFPKKMLFPSRELVREIPRELRTFRFDTYVAGTTSTQGQGVIGLLDEFHAYYHGSRCKFDLFPDYAEAEGSEINGLLEWIRDIQSEMTAYYEFDFFIREYLLKMRESCPEAYGSLRKCDSFTEAYRAVHRAYSGLIRDYEKRIMDEIARMNASGGATAEIRDGTLWITSADGTRSRGATVFWEDRATLEPVLKSGRYNQIDPEFLKIER